MNKIVAGIATLIGGLGIVGSIAATAQTPALFPATTAKTAPALAKGEWVNGTPTTLAAQKGKVVVLAFWTHGCINCQRTVPYWNTWAKKYAGSDVTVLSVHTPELDFERKIENVRRYTKEKGIAFPVVTDNDFATWNAYKVDAWPTTVLIDKEGKIRGRWVGELNYNNSGTYHEVEKAIENLR